MPERTAESPETTEAAPALRTEAAPSVAGAVLALQRSAGNRAVRSMLRGKRRLARAPSLPGFSQAGDTCGAASLVTALFLWDTERASPDNRAVVHACDLALTDSSLNGGDATATKVIELVRTLAQTAGYKLGAKEYEYLSTALATLYHRRRGMTSGQISKLATAIGLRPKGFAGGFTLREILTSDEVKNLSPGEVGQLNWPIKDGQGHAMLLGRHEDGTWFFSDQGQSPPRQMQTGAHLDLVNAIVYYQSTGGWLHDGDKRDLQSLPPTIGFTPMGHIQGFLNRGPEGLLKPGDKLAEIDAGWKSSGEILTAWDYHSRWDALADAKDAMAKDTGPHGGVIVERPSGMFHIWKTNPIKGEANLKVTDIDRDDSKDLVLMKSAGRFKSAWLVLSDPSGKKSSPFQVS